MYIKRLLHSSKPGKVLSKQLEFDITHYVLKAAFYKDQAQTKKPYSFSPTVFYKCQSGFFSSICLGVINLGEK